MTVDEIVDVRMCLEIVFGKQDQWFFVFSHILRLHPVTAFESTVFCPTKSKFNAPSWMNHRKEPLQCFVAEHSTKEMELSVLVSQSVTVSQEEFLTIDFASKRLAMDDHAAFFLKIVSTPDVVIAYEEMDFNAHVSQFRYFPQETRIAFRNDEFEFLPEIEHVA